MQITVTVSTVLVFELTLCELTISPLSSPDGMLAVVGDSPGEVSFAYCLLPGAGDVVGEYELVGGFGDGVR